MSNLQRDFFLHFRIRAVVMQYCLIIELTKNNDSYKLKRRLSNIFVLKIKLGNLYNLSSHKIVYNYVSLLVKQKKCVWHLVVFVQIQIYPVSHTNIVYYKIK